MMRARLAWLLLFAAIAFAFAGTRPIADPDEGRYAETAREMLVTRDWFVPQLQGERHLSKPPLTYWVTAAGLRLCGVNAWGARLFLSLAFFLTILCVIALARTWGMGTTESRAAGLIFATSLLPFICGHLLTTDMFLTLWETLGVLALWKVWRGSEHAWAWRWIFWGAFALAFLTKGPPGWLPLLAAAVFCATAKIFRPQRRVRSWPALAVGIAISSAWFVAIIGQDASMLRYFLGTEVIGRVFTNIHHRAEPWWFYFLIITFGFTPWLFLWPGLAARTLLEIKPDWAGRREFPSFDKLCLNIHAAWRRTHPQPESDHSNQLFDFMDFLWVMISHSVGYALFKTYHFWRRLRRTEDIKFFSFLWFCVPLAVFMVSTSKMFFYVVPLFVPLAVWGGHLLVQWRPSLLPPAPGVKKYVNAGVIGWCVVMLGILLLPNHLSRNLSHRSLIPQLNAYVKKHGASTIYSVDNPHNSISFYSGLRISRVHCDYTSQSLRTLRNATSQTLPVLLTIKQEWTKKLTDQGYTVIASDPSMAVLRITPFREAGMQVPAPAPAKTASPQD